MITLITRHLALYILLTGVFFIYPEKLIAHNGEKHDKKTVTTDKVIQTDTIVGLTITPEDHAAHEKEPSTAHATPDDFPSKHPLIVHFPIVLLLVAAVVAIGNIIYIRKELNWIVTIATVIGFTTAFVAARFVHPHTTGLTAHAQLVLDQHDLYADWTIYLGGFGLVAQVLSHFIFKGRRWSVLVVALILTGTAYAVAMAGHYGAQLVHIEGVGPQGRFLETEHHD